MINIRDYEKFDTPDRDMPKEISSIMPTSSDILSARKLSDGRIVCVGKIFMPNEIDLQNIIKSKRQSNAFLILVNKDGKLPPKLKSTKTIGGTPSF